MAGYLLSGSAVKKVSRVVKKDATTPLRGRAQGSRRIGGQGGRVSDDHPWKMSITTVEDVKYCKVLGGILYTGEYDEDDEEWYFGNYIWYDIPDGLVNLSNYVDGDKVYIYARVANDWEVGGFLNSYPTLTVLTGENDTNFAGNNVSFPQPDLGYYFLPIGYINVTAIPDTEPVQFSYSITQTLKQNASIKGLRLKTFDLVRLRTAKANDTAPDVSYKLFCMEGQAQTPDSTDILPETSITVSTSEIKYVYLNITCVKDATSGGYTDFASAIIFSTDTQASTDTNINYLIGRISNGYILQSQEGNFLSPARIW